MKTGKKWEVHGAISTKIANMLANKKPVVPIPGTDISQIKIDDWFWMEQMSDNHWWMCIGGRTFDIHIPSKPKNKIIIKEQSSDDNRIK